MTIYEKVNKIIQTKHYEFAGMNLEIYNTDIIKIYGKNHDKEIYKYTFDNILVSAPISVLELNYRTELIKKDEDGWCICFYLEAPEKIEKPISMKPKFI